MTENERIRELRKSLGLTMEEFGSNLGVTKTAVSNIENGNRSVTPQMRTSIIREFGVSEAWLREGTGEMFLPKSPDDELADLFADIVSAPDGDDAKELARMWARLTPKQRREVAAAVLVLANAKK